MKHSLSELRRLPQRFLTALHLPWQTVPWLWRASCTGSCAGGNKEEGVWSKFTQIYACRSHEWPTERSTCAAAQTTDWGGIYRKILNIRQCPPLYGYEGKGKKTDSNFQEKFPVSERVKKCTLEIPFELYKCTKKDHSV